MGDGKITGPGTIGPTRRHMIGNCINRYIRVAGDIAAPTCTHIYSGWSNLKLWVLGPYAGIVLVAGTSWGPHAPIYSEQFNHETQVGRPHMPVLCLSGKSMGRATSPVHVRADRRQQFADLFLCSAFLTAEHKRAKWTPIGFLRVKSHGFGCKDLRSHWLLPRHRESENHVSVALPSALLEAERAVPTPMRL